jgi:triacylglycerol lipase
VAREPRRALESEAAAVGEWASLMMSPIYRGVAAPRGDGRLVVVLPGMFGNDFYLQPMRRWLSRIGYTPVRSTLSMNVGCPERLCEQIEIELSGQRQRHPGPVAFIGHSRGGILARAIAARLGPDASHLILLGSPVGAVSHMRSWSAAGGDGTVAAPGVVEAGRRVRRTLDPDCNVPDCGCAFPADLTRRLAARTRVVSIYSRDDPIVPAGACHIAGARNVEVTGTHSGLAFNQAVYREISDALTR